MPASIRNALDLRWQPAGALTYAVVAVGLVAYVAGFLAIPLLQTDVQIALGLFLLLPVLLIGVYVATKAILGDRFAGTIVAVVCIFVVAANFRIRAYDDKSIDWQVGMKLIALTLLVATVIVFLAYAFNRLRLGRLFYEWLFFFAWLVVASLYSKSVAFALTCSVALVIAYFYSVYMAVWLTRERALEIMMFIALLMCVGSIFVFYAVPSMGRMQAWTAAGAIGDIGRMKGLTGSANAIGVIAALAIIIAVLNYRTFGVCGKRLALLLIPSALACLFLSDNRGSMIAMAATFWFVYVIRGDTNFKLVLSITGALVGGALLIGFSDEIFSMLSRSGRTAEITDVSGRRSIWAVVVELWSERPIFGYGYTSGLWILPLDPRLFHVAAHTHNLFLELLFAGGIVLLGIFVYAIYRTFLQIYRLGAVNEGALLFFILIRGLTEAGPFAGMIGYSGFATTITIALVISKTMDARTRRPATRPLTAPRAAPRPRLSRA